MYEQELDMPLDFYIGLLVGGNFLGELGILELPFDFNYHRVPTTQMDWIQSEDEINMLNASSIVFPTATWDWGLVTHFGLYLTEEAADCICVGELSHHKTLIKTDVVNFRPLTLAVHIETLKIEYETLIFGGEQNYE